MFRQCVRALVPSLGSVNPSVSVASSMYLGLQLGRCASTEVKVPSMGDSISDGVIGSLFKKVGDSCDEDEPILQIETDKVAIDVRAPVAGNIQALLVKEEEVVTIGQVVALLDSEAVLSTRSEAAAQPDSTARSQTAESRPSLDDLSVAAYDKQDSALTGHKARIHFPPRRTPDGNIISAMPRADQQKYIDRSMAARSPTSRGSFEVNGPAAASAKPDRGSAVSASPPLRRVIPDHEMEAIMLGGAGP